MSPGARNLTRTLRAAVLASFALVGGCEGSRSIALLREAQASRDIQSAEIAAFRAHVPTATLYINGWISGSDLTFYKVPVGEFEAVPVYFSRADFEGQFPEREPVVIRGEELLLTTRGLGLLFNMGNDPELLWAPDFADDVRSGLPAR